MACLQNFEFVCNILLAALHKFVFGSDVDRSNRQRLREFSGFAFDEHGERFKEKLAILGISSKVADVKLHIFRTLQSATFLCAAAESDENNDDDDDENESYIDDNDEEEVMCSLDETAAINLHFQYPQQTNVRNSENDRMRRRHTST
ncbi:unnamed protein product [Ceratitis capitata]|uniref:(Mediterranean fruit fly) hypothetical protein n=1 Tax=Ceratitis capitata TaxID=7213 RepID=A0A811V8U7_CERCA|nr:unnamed protein product [Ceratitis capitata]